MEIKNLASKLPELCNKYKYAVGVLIIGLVLLLIPNKQKEKVQTVITTQSTVSQETISQESLAQILQSVEGAGKVKVLLSIGYGEETIYQTNSEDENRDNTVIITDAEKNQAGLIRQVNPSIYKGAIVVCQGADSPAVRLAVTQAVSKITGLGTDAICVLKMQ